MQVELAYGRTGLQVQLPDDRPIRILAYKNAVPLQNPERELREVLARPTGTPSLATMAANRRDVCILICDITRPVPNELILTPILETLEAAGIPRDRILILVATGLHRPNVGAELVEMVGRRIAENYRIENHFGCNRDEHTYLGESPRGVPIWIDSRYVNADLKITVGLIEPHFMAGFSGGRKLICPGIAALETVRVWHGPRFLEHPAAAAGVLADNPVHEENTWIARRAGCDFIVNTVIDAERRPLFFCAGDMEAAFFRGVDFVREVVRDTLPQPVDIVITSAAGYPLDTTFYQAVKGMVAASAVVRPGGTIILAASLSQGIGSPEFQQVLAENTDLDTFIDRIEHDYFVMDQWQLEEMAKAVRKATIRVVSDGLPAEVLNRLFVRAAPTVEQAVAEALKEHGPQATIAVIPKGPYVLAQVA